MTSSTLTLTTRAKLCALLLDTLDREICRRRLGWDETLNRLMKKGKHSFQTAGDRVPREYPSGFESPAWTDWLDELWTNDQGHGDMASKQLDKMITSFMATLHIATGETSSEALRQKHKEEIATMRAEAEVMKKGDNYATAIAVTEETIQTIEEMVYSDDDVTLWQYSVNTGTLDIIRNMTMLFLLFPSDLSHYGVKIQVSEDEDQDSGSDGQLSE